MTVNKLIIYGASGHGKVIADIAKRNGYRDIAFFDKIDSNPQPLECCTVFRGLPDVFEPSFLKMVQI